MREKVNLSSLHRTRFASQITVKNWNCFSILLSSYWLMAIDRLCEISFRIFHILTENFKLFLQFLNISQSERTKILQKFQISLLHFLNGWKYLMAFLLFSHFLSPFNEQEAIVIDEHAPPTCPADVYPSRSGCLLDWHRQFSSLLEQTYKVDIRISAK